MSFSMRMIYIATCLLAAVTSALRECSTSTKYAADGLSTKSTPRPLKKRQMRLSTMPSVPGT